MGPVTVLAIPIQLDGNPYSVHKIAWSFTSIPHAKLAWQLPCAALMWFRGGRRLAGNLNEDPHKTGAVLHGHFIGETPGRILQKGLGKLEGPTVT